MSSLVRGKWIERNENCYRAQTVWSSLVRGKWIERSMRTRTALNMSSSLVRGKWIERKIILDMYEWDDVFPREREVD